MTDDKDKQWTVLESEYLIRRPWLTARRDKVRLPNGVENDEYYVLEYPDWVNVIALTEDGKFIMERQYRHGLQWTGYEICAGVMTISPNTSSMNNQCHCFVARGVKRMSAPHREATEDISVHFLTVEEVRSLLQHNEIKQALMLAPLWRYFAEHHLW